MLTKTVKTDLQKWTNLPLSLVGRIQSIKMNVLPRYLYLFQCLPIFLSKLFFRQLDSMILNFIWGGKIPRVRKSLLQRERSQGGLGLPNFQLYYWAANIHKIALWASDTDMDSGWIQLESSSCHSSSLKALVCSSFPLKPKDHSFNPIVTTTLRIWQQIRRQFGWVLLPLATPFCNNQLFLPAKLDLSFALWSRRGLLCLGDLYSDGLFSNFVQLCSKFNLQRSDQYRYFQIRNFARLNTPTFPHAPPTSGIDHFLAVAGLTKGHISFIYDFLSGASPPALQKIRMGWENELAVTFSDDWWDGALHAINSSSSCARLNLIQFKVLHRIHFSKARLSKIYPNLSDVCDRCSLAPANLTHMFWSCPSLVEYWRYFFDLLSEVLEITLDPSAQIAIFGIPEEGLRLTVTQTNVILFASLIARRRILLLWKSRLPPSGATWLSDLASFLKLERIKFAVRGSIEAFYRHWQPLIDCFTGTRSTVI